MRLSARGRGCPIFRGVFKIRGHEIMKLRNKNAETADYSQNTQTGWECGDDANYVVYATDKVGS